MPAKANQIAPTTGSLNWLRVFFFGVAVINAGYAIKYGMACGICEWTHCAALRCGVVAIGMGLVVWKKKVW